MATIILGKEKALSEDLDLGMGSSTGSRDGSQINATNIPYDTANTIAEELDQKVDTVDGDSKYALKNGEATEVFNVSTATTDTEAPPLAQINEILTAYPLTTQVVSALATKAELNGSTAEIFNIFNVPFNVGGPFPTANEAVNFGYMVDWFDGLIAPALNDKADKIEVISKNLDELYTPTLGGHPANKSYVDQKVVDIGAGDMTQANFVNDGTATLPVWSTKNVGTPGTPNGIADADKGVLKLSNVLITDANDITDYGIGIFIGVDFLNSPPATAGIPVAIEQMDMDGTGVMIGQRATTDQGVYSRFGIDDGTGMQFGLWKHTISEEDYATAFAGGTTKLAQAGSTAAIRTDGTDAIVPAEGLTINGVDIKTNVTAPTEARIAANDAKVGITTAQADAITMNTAKVSYKDTMTFDGTTLTITIG